VDVPPGTEVVVVAPATTVDRLFRSRRSGRITVVQRPNAPLLCFLGAVAVRRTVRPTGRTAAWLDTVAGLTLATWATGELVRGVNPWRRILGGSALAVGAVAVVVAGRRSGPSPSAQPPPSDDVNSEPSRRTSCSAGSVVTDAHP